ncbi:TPA: thiamine-binding protein [Staphylococcus aureus]|nr:thiamine-binding protein [Staphylococcus aureus]
MAIVDVVVIPVGTEGPSVSKYIADIQKKLQEYKAMGKIDFQLTPMNTLKMNDKLTSVQKHLENSGENL